MSLQVDKAWIQQHVSLFADDCHLREEFTDEHQLEKTLKIFGLFLDLLEDLGLKVSVTKTTILLSMAGTQRQRCNRKHLVRTSQGVWIRVPRRSGHTLIPLSAQTTYLGIKLNCPTETWQMTP